MMMTFKLINLEQSTTLHIRLIIFLFRRHFRILLCKNLADHSREIVRDQARRSVPLTAGGVAVAATDGKCIIYRFSLTPKN